jgi:hypothetical protein
LDTQSDYSIGPPEEEVTVRLVQLLLPCDRVTRLMFPIALGSLTLLASCGGADSGSYTVSAAVSGLQAGTSLVLLNNGANSTLVSANGTNAFSKPISSGGSFSVTVATQPTGETCGASPGSHTSGFSNVNVTVAVACTANPYTIGGMVNGLVNNGRVVLQNNHANIATISGNGAFTFASTALSGTTYAVTVLTQPPGETCAVTSGSGTVGGANVSNVSVKCTPLPFKLTVGVFGITTTTGLVLQNNDGDNLTVPTSVIQYTFGSSWKRVGKSWSFFAQI